MYRIVTVLCLCLCSCNSTDKNGKEPSGKVINDSSKTEQQQLQTGAPSKEEAKQIMQGWFDHFKTLVGGYSYEPEKFEVVSVTGNEEKAEINFIWSGTYHSASIPGSDNSPVKVANQKKKLLIKKREGKWEDYEVRGQ